MTFFETYDAGQIVVEVLIGVLFCAFGVYKAAGSLLPIKMTSALNAKYELVFLNFFFLFYTAKGRLSIRTLGLTT